MLRATDLSYQYPSSSVPDLKAVSLDIPRGQMVVLAGPTGSGKSTLLRMLAGLTQRHGQGQHAGAVELDGVDIPSMTPQQRAQHLAFVSQSPEDQLVCQTVIDELCFGLENAGASPEVIEPTAMSWLDKVGLSFAPSHRTSAMSGGQQQRLVVGSAMAAGSRLILLDEPLAQLDPAGASELAKLLQALTSDGFTVVVAEHRLPMLWDVADRLVVLSEGRVCSDTPLRAAPISTLKSLGLAIPPLLEFNQLRGDQALTFRPAQSAKPKTEASPGEIKIPAARVVYDGASTPALETQGFTIAPGERIAVLGPNGSGKSTLLRHIRDVTGRQSVMVPQNADLTLFNPTVFDEIAFGPRERGLDDEGVSKRVDSASLQLGLGPLAERAPHSLSMGQRVRLAVASALSCSPDLLLLDEPTSGQDAGQLQDMMANLSNSHEAGALIFSTHDVTMALMHSTRVFLMTDGAIAFDGTPEQAMSQLTALDPWVAFCHAHGLSMLTPEQAAGRLDD